MLHPRHRQTDGPTDGQTTSDRETARSTVVHRAPAVKTAHLSKVCRSSANKLTEQLVLSPILAVFGRINKAL